MRFFLINVMGLFKKKTKTEIKESIVEKAINKQNEDLKYIETNLRVINILRGVLETHENYFSKIDCYKGTLTCTLKSNYQHPPIVCECEKLGFIATNHSGYNSGFNPSASFVMIKERK